MFKWSEEDASHLAELNGIEELAKELAECYEERLPEIVAYILPELEEIFENLTAEKLTAALGKPRIDLDGCVITYLEQTLDKSHIFDLEFDGALEEFLEFSMDG